MFRFATTALKQFSGDLSQWPQYCTHLKQVRWAPIVVLCAELRSSLLFESRSCGKDVAAH